MLTCRSFLLAALVAALLPAWSYADTTIDASHATHIALPTAGDGPVAFKTPDGKEGWVRRLSQETIPTPAFDKGRIFTGRGMKSTSFLALDALTGKTFWEKITGENGPTSPVVSGGLVCYNTESCDTESRDEDSGDMVWRETTGGTLLTQAVVAGDLLVIPHPTMARRPGVNEDAFRLLIVDLKTGKHHYDANMTGDVMGAPVSVGGRVFFTCTDGRLFCVVASGEGLGWHAVANANSAPVVVGKTVAVSVDEKRGGNTVVSIRRYTMEDGDLIDDTPLAPTLVADAKLLPGQRADWDYQGPKLAANARQLFNAPGRTVNSVDLETGKPLWKSIITGSGLTNAANSLTPPALGTANLYLGSVKGDVLALKQSDGTLAFAYNVGQPLASQPILADGNLYFGTANGLLVCLKLNDPDAKNWHVWGGDATHNKVQ